MDNDSVDLAVYLSVLNGDFRTAAVHLMTASMEDLIEVPKSLQPASSIDLWKKYYLPALQNDGLVSESDFETKLFPDVDTLDGFLNVNGESVTLTFEDFNLVDTESHTSKQDACSTIEGCTGWWRFSRIGYNADKTEAIVHTDYDHPKYGLMGTGHFVLLSGVGVRWLVVAKHMTWIS